MGNTSIPIMGALRTILGAFPENRPSDFSPHWCQDFREIGRFWCCCGWICLSRWVGFTGWNHTTPPRKTFPGHRKNSEGIWTQKIHYLKYPEVFQCLRYVATYTFQVCTKYNIFSTPKKAYEFCQTFFHIPGMETTERKQRREPRKPGFYRWFLWRFPRKLANSTKQRSRLGSVFGTNRYPKIMLGILFR